MKRIMTEKPGTFVDRTIPVVGWLVLANDVAQIGFDSLVRYNRIISKVDKI